MKPLFLSRIKMFMLICATLLILCYAIGSKESLINKLITIGYLPIFFLIGYYLFKLLLNILIKILPISKNNFLSIIKVFIVLGVLNCISVFIIGFITFKSEDIWLLSISIAVNFTLINFYRKSLNPEDI